MSPRAPKKCAHPGCEARVVGRAYCAAHQPAHGWTNGGTTRTNTSAHRKWRAAVLERDNYICQIKGPRCLGTATTADHLVPVKFGGDEYEKENGQASCAPCNQWKAAYEGHEGRRRARAEHDQQTLTTPLFRNGIMHPSSTDQQQDRP